MANIQTNTRNTYYAILSLTEQSQSNAANSTTLAYTLTLYNGKTSFSGYTIGYRVKIDGVQVAYHDNTGNKTSMGWNESKLLVSGTTTVVHNDDGNKTVSVEIEVWTDSNPYLPIYISGSGQVKLTQILRESTISATDANIGAVSMIAVNRKSAAYTHSIRYTFGSLSGYITADGGVSASEVKLSSTYIGWTLPESFYAQIPNAKSAKCTLTCKTYSGSTQIGSAKTCTLTCVAAESVCAPQITASVEASDELTPTLTGSSTKLIRYCSDALCTISATARNSATLKQKRIAGQVIDGTSRTISAIKADAVTFDATDSRGYTTSVTLSVDLVPYVKLTCRASTTRETPTGDKVMLYISGSWYNGSFGAADNTLTLKYKVDGASAWTEVTPTLTGNTYSAQVELTGVSYNETHTLSVAAADKLSTVQVSDTIKRGVPVFDWGEHDFEFHIPVYFQGQTLEGMLALNGDAITGVLPITKGGTGAKTKADALANLKALPLAGGAMDAGSKITHPGNSSAWAGGRDLAILRRPDAVRDRGLYYPIISSKTVDGDWTIGTLDNGLFINYTSDTAYSNWTGNTHQFLLNSDGNIFWPGGAQVLVNGTLGASASSVLRANFDGRIFKNLVVMIRSISIGGDKYSSFVFPTIAGVWGLFLPTSNDYYRAAMTISGSGASMSCMLQLDSNVTGVTAMIYATA